MQITDYFEFLSVPRIVYGPKSFARAAKVAKRLKCRKPFIVMDPIFVDRGLLEKLEEQFRAEGMEPAGSLTDIPQDSEVGVVRAGYDAASKGGADLVVALGGGSTIDTAKGIRVMLGEGGVLPEGVNVIKKELPPMLAIPTTAGTGSEATSAAVIKDKERGLKIGYTDPSLMPTAALLDPELTVSMPPAVTAGTGMDAMAHAVGSLHSTMSQKISEGLAMQAIKMISRSLVTAVKKPDDIEARGEMLLAATIAGTAFSNTLVGIEHAAAHSLGAVFSVPHGTACGIMLPYAMEFNLGTEAEEAYAEAARAMGVDTAGKTTREAAMLAVRAVRELAIEAGIPVSLKDAGVPEDGIETLVDKSLMDGTMMTNPRQPTEDQLGAFFKKAWMGAEPCDMAMEEGKKDKEPEKEEAAAPAEEEKKEEKEEQADFSIEDMYKVAGGFVKKLFTNEAVTGPLKKSGLIIRFIYFNEQWGDEEASITVDCTKDPIDIQMGSSDAEPVVSMRMSSETARLFWLQKLNLMSAISKGDIQVEGAVNEAMRLLPVIKPGFALFKDVAPDA